MGKSRAISLENVNLAEFASKARVVLTRELGLYEMRIVPDSEPQDALCFQPLKFPYRESDQANLLFLKKTYTEAIQAHLQSFEPVERKAKAVFNNLPKLQYNDTGELTFDDIVHCEAQLEKKIAKERTIGKIRANLFANLNEAIQLPRIGVQLLTQLFRITNMIQFVTDTVENLLVTVEQIFNSAYLWSEDKKLPHELFRIEDDLVLQIGEAIIKNIPTIRDIINRTNFWDFSFFDLILFFMSVLAVTAVLTATICRHFYKSKQHSALLREIQNKRNVAETYTVKQVQVANKPIKETKTIRPFTGRCTARRRHSMDIPTTMKISALNRLPRKGENIVKTKKSAPTAPKVNVKSINQIPVWLGKSFTSLNE